MMHHTWTHEIHDLVETLTCRVRVLSLNHVQRGWREHFGSSKAVLQNVQRLVKADLLQGDVWSLPASPLDGEPLCQWAPQEAEPDFIQLEQVIQNRWDAPVTTIPVIVATQKAARLFGSPTCGLPPENHRNHDLLLAEVYLRYRVHQPMLAARWIGEDAIELAERGIKNPDAFLFDEHGDVLRVIESAGRYSLRQLESFHRHCQSEQLPYELW